MNKRISQAFGKTQYLLGEDIQGEYVWLEGPSWDCGWYWGFGYIERFTQTKHPELSRDISSHTHWENEIVGKMENGQYIHHPNENPMFKQTVLTDNESWELADLMNSYYTMKRAAECFRHGHAYLSKPKVTYENPEMESMINKEIMPLLFARIAEILTPANRDRR